MNLRMRTAAGWSLIAIVTLAGCTGQDSEPGSGPSTSATATPTAGPTSSPTTNPTGPTAAVPADLVGSWRDDQADWTVRFAQDGTFVEDFEGIADFRSGDWEIDGATVRLIGADGNTDEGTITTDGLEFRLGTLTKR